MKFNFNYRKFVAAGMLAGWVLSAGAAENAVTAPFQKPAWLTDLSAGIKESHDDNLLLVADKTPGMSAQASWITTISPKVGFNFAPLLGTQKTLQTLSLVYAPDFALYHDASSENYNAHKLANVIKGKTGDFSFALDNAFLFNDGDSAAPIYALGQGAAAEQADKNRSAFATGAPRERRKQIQDRATVVLQYDVDKFFIRPTASLLFYDLMTDWHKSSVAPYKGYQNYVDRADVNGGLDLGCKVTTDLAVTVGYRYGHQYQQAFGPAVDATNQSSSDYQRILLGLEGKPWKWLTVKLAGGPDFRDYNSSAPMNDHHPVCYYGEASLTAAITGTQSLSFTHKYWRWVASTGKYAYTDSSYALAYHWNATKQLGFDLSAKYAEGDYTEATDSQCLRDDAMYSLSAGVGYAFTSHFSASLTYGYDLGRNQQDNLPASGYASYRDFDHQLVSLGAQWKF